MIGEEKANASQGVKISACSEYAVFITSLWISTIFFVSLLIAIPWFQPGDFTLSTARFYHGIMIPLLVLMYLAIQMMLPKLRNQRGLSVWMLFTVFCAGIGSVLNRSEGFSVATAIQLVGMLAADLVGIVLLVKIAPWSLLANRKSQEHTTALGLLGLGLFTIIAAATCGHLAGFLQDFGPQHFPGVTALLHTTGMKASEFREALVGSHSHLIAAAFLCALAALTALFLQYSSRSNWRRRTTVVGLWIAGISLILAAVTYCRAAMFGWEPPSYFVSGPNGIPADDIILTLLEIGFLLMLLGLSGKPVGDNAQPFSYLDQVIRAALFLNWIAGFMGTVILGIYIEFHENFYGAGLPPAPGALNDNIFIRAHLLYSFLLLPSILVLLLIVGYRHRQTHRFRTWAYLMAWTAIGGICLGFIGELLWFFTLQKPGFVMGAGLMVLAFVSGTISLVPSTTHQQS